MRVLVIPCFKTDGLILETVRKSLAYVDHVVVVDDKCPQNGGREIQKEYLANPRITVLFRETNGGVGAASKDGFLLASKLGARHIIKIDGDDQMESSLIPDLCSKLDFPGSDYVKGNRFYSPESLEQMPLLRIIGNAGLSLLSKLSTGYWSINDPTNGFIAFKEELLREISFDKVDNRFFFESDLLFRLRVRGCKISEVAMTAKYGSERSTLSPVKSVFRFSRLHLRNLIKRIVYQYYVREWSLGSILLPTSLIFTFFGSLTGISAWNLSHQTGIPATSGTVLLSALPIILGVQLWISFIAQDIESEPREAQILS